MHGLNKFKEYFRDYNEYYTIIGGVACWTLFDEQGVEFRTTKDIDIVIIMEYMDEKFGEQFWQFIKAAGYQTISTTKSERKFYRFEKPEKTEYPKQIEIFSRKPLNIKMASNTQIVPIHISDEISSLSAILLNDNYYNFLINGAVQIQGISVLNELYLIPFKAKAWLDLSERKEKGEHIQSNNIKKHLKDIVRLLTLIPVNNQLKLSYELEKDMLEFINKITKTEALMTLNEDRERKQLTQRLEQVFLLQK